MDTVSGMSPEPDLDVVAKELVALYRQIARLLPGEEAWQAGRALGRALEALERARSSAAAAAVAKEDIALAEAALLRLRGTLISGSATL